jgi:trimeric autotransporter adhesin
MSSRMLKFRLLGAFTALAMLALAVSCKGFFVPEQLASITISPATANVPLGGTAQLEAFGTNTDSTAAGNITGSVTWTSDSGAITVSKGGLLTGNDLTSSAVTITAESQGVSGTATANVCVTDGTNFQIVLSATTVTAGTNPTAIAQVNIPKVSGPVDISSGVTWSTNNASVTISNGDPAQITTSTVTNPPVTVAIIATYACSGVSKTFQTNLNIN